MPPQPPGRRLQVPGSPQRDGEPKSLAAEEFRLAESVRVPFPEFRERPIARVAAADAALGVEGVAKGFVDGQLLLQQRAELAIADLAPGRRGHVGRGRALSRDALARFA